jgi:hypothetical protein
MVLGTKPTFAVLSLVSVMAFVLSLDVIATATMASTSILHGRFNQIAENAYQLMVREFEYDFVTTRWSFLVSLFCFLGVVTSRLMLEFDSNAMVSQRVERMTL